MARVLVVDDTSEARLLLRAILKYAGHDVSESTNGQEALDRVREGGIDLVISDGLMPVMDGFRLCFELRHDPIYRDIPFIIYTASFMAAGDTDLASELGVDAYLFKPTDPALIGETIDRLLAEPRTSAHRPRSDAPALVTLFTDYGERLDRKLEEKVINLQEARSSRDMVQSLLDSLPLLVATADADGIWNYQNEAARAFSQLALKPGATPGFLIPKSPDDCERIGSAVQEGLEHAQAAQVTVRTRRHDDHLRTLKVTFLPYNSADGKACSLLAAGVDITEEEERRELLLHLAEHDALTDLPNRRVLDSRFGEVLRDLRTGDTCALLFIDVDGLKVLNDERGHDVGDAVLVNIASLLTHSVRPADLVVRLCGDEFVVVAENLGWDEAVALSETIRSNIASANLVPLAADQRVTVSIGVNVVPEVSTPAEALRAADAAMYEAKAAGRDRTVRAPRTDDASDTTPQLQVALADPEPTLEFAPVYSLENGALVRCAVRPTFRVGNADLSQRSFMIEAMRSGLSRRVSDSIIAKTLDSMAGTDIHCSVRLSLADVLDSGTFQRTELEAERRGVDPAGLMFEVDAAHVLDGALVSTWLDAARNSRIRLLLDCESLARDRLVSIGLEPFQDIEVSASTLDITEESIESIARIADAAPRRPTVTVMEVDTPERLSLALAAGATGVQGNAIVAATSSLEAVPRVVRIG